jgi:hypothetical protein
MSSGPTVVQRVFESGGLSLFLISGVSLWQAILYYFTVQDYRLQLLNDTPREMNKTSTSTAQKLNNNHRQ